MHIYMVVYALNIYMYNYNIYVFDMIIYMHMYTYI